jgi:molybdopterin-guanine dinucleotide biosynthesis protein A
MIRRVVDRLGTVTESVIINCRDDQQAAIRSALEGCDPPIEFAIDAVPDRGPIGGIHDGLRVADTAYTAVVACDMPFVDPSLIRYLRGRAAGADGAVVQLDDQWYQTTQAVYRSDPMAAACGAVLEAGGGRILDALDGLEWVVVDEDDLAAEGVSPDVFEGIDTQEALREAENRL